MKFKKIIGVLHLWLGLVSGLVVFIISITGCLYAFKTEIESVTQDYRFVKIQEKAFLPPSHLKEIGNNTLPGKHLHAINYPGKGKSAEAIFYNYQPYYYFIIYLNPYTGEVIKVVDMKIDFFNFVLQGHYYLWLPPAIGQPIVAYTTLIFIVMLISGIILWWPKNKSAAKQRFSFKWKKTTRWKRKNYDLHNIIGFYASWIVQILALTGLVWGCQWFANSVYWRLGGEKSLVYQESISEISQKGKTTEKSPAIDRVWYKMLKEHTDAQTIEVHIPETDTSLIAANVNTDIGTIWKTDYRYFDQYTLKELPVNHIYGRLKDAKLADKVMRMNYDIHIGAILGLPGKILAFFVSLMAASLPITGFYIWWGRRKNEKKSKNKSLLKSNTIKSIS